MAVGFILITTEPGCEIQVREEVSKIQCVKGQWIVFGNHDLFVKVEAENESDLTRCIVPVSYTHLTLPTILLV